MRTVTLILCGIVLASCSRMTGSSPLPVALPNGESLHPLTGTGYKSLYSFQGGKNGAFPYGGLTYSLEVGSGLYGTTFAGGGGSGCSGGGCGTITDVSGGVLHSFLKDRKGGTDGAGPMGTLLAANDSLYGTTTAGGMGCSTGPDGGGCGTVFELTYSRRNKYRVLYRFKGGADGEEPVGGVITINGTVFMLYGTTEYGGTNNDGTVYEISKSGKERVLYSFKGGTDGAFPVAGLAGGNGMLYGTTLTGGSGCGSIGCGTVFEVTTSGAEQVFYSFKGGTDGASPVNLYGGSSGVTGTTQAGGRGCSSGPDGGGCGTIFDVSASGKERVMYRFKGGTDGEAPSALTYVLGRTYGTTAYGGDVSCGGSSGRGCGTVFEFARGKERVLYSFKGEPDGANPGGNLAQTYDGSPLYGTTAKGGSSGYGTAFSISP